MGKIILVVLGFLASFARGNDPFQSGIVMDCFRSTKMSGCNGTLVGSFKPRSRGTGLTSPDTKVFLFTRGNPVNPEFLHECGGRLPENTNFNPRAKTEILIHGYINQPCSQNFYRDMKVELLERGEYNVILVDWSWGSSFDYHASIVNEPVVGEQIAFVIKNIMKQTGVSASNFHIIGQSSGAHVAGFVGQNVKNLRRITGLDPSAPGHIGKPPDEILDRTDAQLVDIMHTSAADCLVFGLGYPGQLGHADFYVNGGSIQLNCFASSILEILRQDYVSGVATLLIPPLCYHDQALLYYKVSINPGDCQFVGVECPNYESFKSGVCHSCGTNGSRCAVMGMDFDKYYKNDGKNHTYYVDTKFFCDFCDQSMYNKFQQSFPTNTYTKTRNSNKNVYVNSML